MAFERIGINLSQMRLAGEQALVEDLREREAVPYGPGAILAAGRA